VDKSLKRELGLLDVFCIASGAMISSGLFILPGIAFSKTGPSLFLSYLIASLLAVPAMFSKAELTTAMPRAGGDYFFITRSMGFAIGTIGGAASWFSLSLKSAFALIGMSAYVALITDIPITLIAVTLCAFFVALNIIGVRETGLFQRFLVLGLMAVLLFYMSHGFASVDITRFSPFAPKGAPAVFATAGFVFISYGGLTKIASIAEEVKKPGRNIPLGMILSIIVVGLFYALVVFVTTGVLAPEVLRNSLTPISDAARAFMGPLGSSVMAFAAMLAFISTANAGILSASRYPIAMSRDKLLPPVFKRINSRFSTPHYSIFFTGLFMALAIAFLKLELLVKVASTFLIILFMLANLAVIIMRESRIQNYRPKFTSPLYPWMQIAGMISGLFLILEMGIITYKITGLFAAAGLFWYLLYAHRNVKKEFALIHVIERITNKELTTYSLEGELKEILRERDDIIEDRFDRLIDNCAILDLEGPLTVDAFFEEAAAALAGKMGLDKGAVKNLLAERERETTTALRPGLAIPHLIIDGEKKFDILLTRCKGGIIFSKKLPPVYAVFVLAGTRDERNFHLRALASIAQITESKGFDEKWLAAKNIDELKDVILLASRRRHTR
jgi:amino acid transporter/mannitol/fructose-specific phosphotransferase system IIA component (Ntr-type)